MAKKHKLGIVFSGGGAKGLAHIGVLFYLKELGIVPDAVAGTSAGSIIGSMYAYGIPLTQIQEFFLTTDLFDWERRSFFKSNVLFRGIVDPKTLKKDLLKVFPDDDFRHCDKELSIVATNMLSAEEKVFTSGSITDAILASIAYPFVFSPMEIDDQLYSDGGILNHFPVDVLREQCEKIIGVYVSPIRQYEKGELNNIQKITLRALSLKGDKAELKKLEDCDVHIFPQDLIHYNTFDTDPEKLIEIVEVGYDEAAKYHDQLIRLRRDLREI
ncbi:patatin-like phospholipase family protein [Flammeovirga sp. EKP202]|uniref:patatin-like phospholipase family protein n=1 Tax=Flammeovirga sp. EKP202 TaxID=2770592 RepID=UPI00165ED63F|nr:patatin-like phospholipase family protein [Flammeovirga sp. EKP202]MBD0404584.1 patatin-like phospholipase family protein [Flammeovirga sp. EKP202]